MLQLTDNNGLLLFPSQLSLEVDTPKRGNPNWKNKYRAGRTTPIRIPVAYQEQVKEFIRQLDHPDQLAIAIGSALTDHDLQNSLLQLLNKDRRRLSKDVINELELAVNDVFSPQDGEAVLVRWLKNIYRINAKRDRIHSIQLANNISGLEMGQLKISDGVIDYWKQVDDLWLTDDDLDRLRGDRPKLLQFWIDHVELNQLQVFRFDDLDWVESSIDAARLASYEHDWADPYEHISYFDKSHWIRASVGEVMKTSATPKEGYEKDHEIHLRLGCGKYLDDPEFSVWFCATNQDCPSY